MSHHQQKFSACPGCGSEREKDLSGRWLCRGCKRDGRKVHSGRRCPDTGKPSTAYNSWNAMRQRTTNAKHKDWYLYGGRGIKCCDEWATFAGFYRDMGDRPDGTSLDRIDVDGSYEPGNCRWATAEVQGRNKRPKPVAC